MSFEFWFWVVFTGVATAESIRQFLLLREALAIPDDWNDFVSDHDVPREGGHGSHQSRH